MLEPSISPPRSEPSGSRQASFRAAVPKVELPNRLMWSAASRYALIAALAIVYAWFAAGTYLGAAPLAVVALTLLGIAGLSVMTGGGRSRKLDSMQFLSAAFMLAFVIGPLAQPDDWFYYTRFDELAAMAAWYCLAAYLALVVGYYAPDYVALPLPKPRKRSIPDRALERLGIQLFLLGGVAYILFIVAIGGPSQLFSSDEANVERFIGYGVLGWPTSLLISGSVLYCARWVADRNAKPWQALWLVVICVALLVPLQGRSRAAHAGVAALLIFYHSKRRFRWALLVPLGAVAWVVAMFVGFARQLWVRPLLLTEPGTVILAFLAEFKDLAHHQLYGSLSRLWTVMLVIDRIPDEIPYQWGKSFLFALNPILRRLGLTEFVSVGFRLWDSAITVNPSDLAVGLNPSMVGEVWVNFPWWIGLWVLALGGYALRWLHTNLLKARADTAGVALYALVIGSLNAAVISSIGNDLIYAVAVIVPVWLGIRWLESFPTRSAGRGQRRARDHPPSSLLAPRVPAQVSGEG